MVPHCHDRVLSSRVCGCEILVPDIYTHAVEFCLKLLSPDIKVLSYFFFIMVCLNVNGFQLGV